MKHSALQRKTPLRGHTSLKRTPMKKRPTKVVTCDECGQEFERRTDAINRYPHNYCSRECANTANGRKNRGSKLPSMRTGDELTCEVCKNKFYVSSYRLHHHARFCSRKCYATWIKEHPNVTKLIKSVDNSGTKNGHYKHGNRVGGCVPKKKVRDQVISRDGNWCLFCGKPPKGLHLHRVIYGSHGGKYEPQNCVQLCAEHHALVHSSKRTWQHLLLEYLQRTDGFADFTAREWIISSYQNAVQKAKELAEVR